MLEILLFTATVYFGGLVFQVPIGICRTMSTGASWIVAVALLGTVAQFIMLMPMPFWALRAWALVIGGIANPLYALLLAYTNDYLEHDMMAAASGGLLFVNGLGAIIGPLVIGRMMGQ